MSADRTHSHLWTLADGTPAHAPPGELTRNDEDQLACHLCGRWFTHLGLHLRAHGWSPAEYRAAVGLPTREPLCSTLVSSGIAGRQRRAWQTEPALRERLAAGQALAASGELNRLSVAARESGQVRPSVRASQLTNLAAGRRTREQRSRKRLTTAITEADAADLHDLLRRAYTAGGTLESVAALTGLGRQRLRAELAAAGVEVRPTGHNVPASRRARAVSVDAAVGDRIGAVDVPQWLRERRAAGATMQELADVSGRSTTWVRCRLTGRTTT